MTYSRRETSFWVEKGRFGVICGLTKFVWAIFGLFQVVFGHFSVKKRHFRSFSTISISFFTKTPCRRICSDLRVHRTSLRVRHTLAVRESNFGFTRCRQNFRVVDWARSIADNFVGIAVHRHKPNRITSGVTDVQKHRFFNRRSVTMQFFQNFYGTLV